MRIALLVLLCLLVQPMSTAALPSDDSRVAADAVLVIGALHGLHDREPAFGYELLRTALREFAPDVLVLEVRDDELAERKLTPGRPEYPAVIWPLLERPDVKAVAMEPSGDTFKAITGEAGAAFDALNRENAEGAAALSRLESAAEEVLLNYWRCAGQTQDGITASLADGLQAAQFALAGPRFAAAQARWESHMANVVQEAVRAHPGKRVMVIGSYKNRIMLQRAVHAVAAQRATDSMKWLDRVSRCESSGREVK
jgi:hypothetical protein